MCWRFVDGHWIDKEELRLSGSDLETKVYMKEEREGQVHVKFL